jgi:hypothetical protein
MQSRISPFPRRRCFYVRGNDQRIGRHRGHDPRDGTGDRGDTSHRPDDRPNDRATDRSESDPFVADVLRLAMEHASRLVDYDTARDVSHEDVSHEVAVELWQRRGEERDFLARPEDIAPHVCRAVAAWLLVRGVNVAKWDAALAALAARTPVTAASFAR